MNLQKVIVATVDGLFTVASKKEAGPKGTNPGASSSYRGASQKEVMPSFHTLCRF